VRDKAARRQQLLSLGRQVFAERGYHNTTVEDIVSAAKVARGTFYLYFADKRTLFEEIVDRLLMRLTVSIQRVDVRQPVAGQVMGNIQRVVHVLLEDGETTKILLTSAAGIDAAFDQKMRAFFSAVTTLLVESLVDGQELGIVARGNPRVQALLTLGALKELFLGVADGGADVDEADLAEGIFEFFRTGYLRAS
jgi:AcrR family transcriptional regulator